MATTVTQAFREFQTNLNITELQGSTVSTRQQNVRDAVASELAVLDDFLTGSYRRHTLIAPLSEADIDVFIVLDPKYHESGGQASLLDRVRRVLLKTYPKTPRISRNGQAVTITFGDFRVDVVPGFYRNGGGYLIPDSVRGQWIGTNPKRHVELWSESNTAHGGDLVPLMKMLKCWNRAHSALLTSFHLETLTREVLTGVTIHNSPSGARFVFDRARAPVLSGGTGDPAGYGDNVARYLDTYSKRSDAHGRLDTAYTKASEAEALERDGKTTAAIVVWSLSRARRRIGPRSCWPDDSGSTPARCLWGFWRCSCANRTP